MLRTRRFVPHILALVLVGGSLSIFGGAADPKADPELVTLTATPDRSAVEPDTAATMVVRVDLAADARPEDATIGVNLGLLLDTSGSMAGEPIEQARAAVHALVDELRPIDRLTIVTFDSRAQLVLPMTTIDDADLDELHDRIDAIEARGTTDMAAGLGTLLQQLHANPTVGDLDRIVLVSDGVPNDPSPIGGQVENARQAGFAITTLGVGLEYDELLLGEVARDSGGKFHHVEHGEELGETVIAELVGAQRQVAGNVRLELSTGPGVTLRRVIGHSPEMSGGHSYAIVLAELAEGEAQQVFVEVDVAPAKAGTTLELLDAIVSFDDRAAGSGRLERRAFVAMPVGGDREVLALRSAEVELGAVGARAAAATIDAIALSRQGNIEAADVLLNDNEIALQGGLLANGDDVAHAPKLLHQSEQIGHEIKKMREELQHYRAVPRPSQGEEAVGAGGSERWQRVTKEANAASIEMLQAHK